MNRRQMIVNGLLIPVLLSAVPGLPGMSTPVCPPAKFHVGALVEHESGYRLYVQAALYKQNKWWYDLGPFRQVLIAGVPEAELTEVK